MTKAEEPVAAEAEAEAAPAAVSPVGGGAVPAAAAPAANVVPVAAVAATVRGGPAANGCVKVMSADGGFFELPIAAARVSQLVNDSITETDPDADDPPPAAEPIELLRVGRACLGKVVEFLKHYSEEPMNPIPSPLGAGAFEDVVTQQWYRDFCNEEGMPREMLFDVLRAANYMSIPPLLDLACLKVTFQLHGRNADEIREMLNLPTLTPDEEETARQEHRWIFETAQN